MKVPHLDTSLHANRPLLLLRLQFSFLICKCSDWEEFRSFSLALKADALRAKNVRNVLFWWLFQIQQKSVVGQR